LVELQFVLTKINYKNNYSKKYQLKSIAKDKDCFNTCKTSSAGTDNLRRNNFVELPTKTIFFP